MPRVGAIGIVCALAAALAASAAAHEINLHKLPLGDGKLSHAPKRGWIWACHVDPQAGGAQVVGPWINLKTKTYDLTAKLAVRGSVRWPHSFKIALRGDKRVFTSNDYPSHPTGHFPIARNDPAYRIDRNPNSIRRQRIHFELPANPKIAARARCAPGAVGILLTGVALFNALDAPGRDAVAHETQDSCHGHPQEGGVYHYHSLTNCLNDKPDADGNSPLVGYAIDGFGIYGPYENGRQLTTARSRRLSRQDRCCDVGRPQGEDVSLRGDGGFSLHGRLPAREFRSLRGARHLGAAAAPARPAGLRSSRSAAAFRWPWWSPAWRTRWSSALGRPAAALDNRTLKPLPKPRARARPPAEASALELQA